VQSVATEKVPSVIPPGIDPEIVRLVAQCFNHYVTPGSRPEQAEAKNVLEGAGEVNRHDCALLHIF
jgi:hypothetical protein